MWRQKDSKGWRGLIPSGSFAALRMTAKTKEAMKTKRCRFAEVVMPWRCRCALVRAVRVLRGVPHLKIEMWDTGQGMWKQKDSKGWGGLIPSGSFAALRMTAKTKEATTKYRDPSLRSG
jgi:hypothetical protein